MCEEIIHFQKYRTCGNAFLVFDNRESKYDELMKNTFLKKCLQEDVFGLGSVGIIEIQKDKTEPYHFMYHIGTGDEGKACGTGSICSVIYAKDNLIVPSNCTKISFRSYEGLRYANIEGSRVKVSMDPTFEVIEYDSDNYFGSPGWDVHVKFVKSDIEKESVIELGKKELFNGNRYNHLSLSRKPTFMLAQILEDGEVRLRCYDPSGSLNKEAFNCGTGSTVTAAASMIKLKRYGATNITLKWRYGNMNVYTERNEDAKSTFTNTYLEGTAHRIATCSLNLNDYSESSKCIDY